MSNKFKYNQQEGRIYGETVRTDSNNYRRAVREQISYPVSPELKKIWGDGKIVSSTDFTLKGVCKYRGQCKKERCLSHICDEVELLAIPIPAVEKDSEADMYDEAMFDVIAEVRRAKTMFKENFHNQHEGYAVILEEIDELWQEVKKNQRNYDIPAQRKEAIQCAAMCIRFIAELTPKI